MNSYFQEGNKMAGGMGGGGFMNDSQSQSPAIGSGGKKVQRSQTLLPITAAILYKAEYNTTDDVFKYDGTDVHQVTFVGIIKEVQEAATNIGYKIDDGTGEFISVKKWIDSDETSAEQYKRSECREDTYVRVVGHMKSFNEGAQRSVIAFIIQPVKDFNEITMHMLDVIYSNLMLKKAAAGGGAAAGAGGAMQTPNRNNGIMDSFSNGGAGGGGMDAGLQGTNKLVMSEITQSQQEQGISIQELQAKVRQCNESQIRTAIEWLSNEGHIYSTIDDDHFRSTSN